MCDRQQAVGNKKISLSVFPIPSVLGDIQLDNSWTMSWYSDPIYVPCKLLATKVQSMGLTQKESIMRIRVPLGSSVSTVVY